MSDFNFQQLAELKKQQILKGFVDNDIEKSEESFEKARHGVYADNAENQRLHRVGQEYGTKGKSEEGGSKTGGKSEESSDKEGGSDGKLSEHAKNASEEALNRAIKNSTDPKIREAAHAELKRRETEEKKVESQDEFNEKNDVSKKSDEELKKMIEEGLNHTEARLELKRRAESKRLSKPDKKEPEKKEEKKTISQYDEKELMESAKQVVNDFDNYVEDGEDSESSGKRIKETLNKYPIELLIPKLDKAFSKVSSDGYRATKDERLDMIENVLEIAGINYSVRKPASEKVKNEAIEYYESELKKVESPDYENKGRSVFDYEDFRKAVKEEIKRLKAGGDYYGDKYDHVENIKKIMNKRK